MSAQASVLRQYWSLTKPRVVALIVFTALVGSLLAVDGLPDATELRHGLLGFLGIWLAASSAATINQLLDSRIDAKMARTSWRPIVVGHSWGANVALELAVRHPRLVSGAILLDGGFSSMRDRFDWRTAKRVLSPPAFGGIPVEGFLQLGSRGPG